MSKGEDTDDAEKELKVLKSLKESKCNSYYVNMDYISSQSSTYFYNESMGW